MVRFCYLSNAYSVAFFFCYCRPRACPGLELANAFGVTQALRGDERLAAVMLLPSAPVSLPLRPTAPLAPQSRQAVSEPCALERAGH